jgi:hypothetical protein
VTVRRAICQRFPPGRERRAWLRWAAGVRERSPSAFVLHHIKRLDDCFGDFLVRVTCPCGTSRHIEPEALARIAERSVTRAQRPAVIKLF